MSLQRNIAAEYDFFNGLLGSAGLSFTPISLSAFPARWYRFDLDPSNRFAITTRYILIPRVSALFARSNRECLTDLLGPLSITLTFTPSVDSERTGFIACEGRHDHDTHGSK